MDARYLTAATAAYEECALWSSLDDDSEPLDATYTVEDITPDGRAWMRADVVAFLDRAGDLVSDLDAEQVGHDFWLTRNGHGAGFWDRGLGELGEQLSEIARTFGEAYLFAEGASVDYVPSTAPSR